MQKSLFLTYSFAHQLSYKDNIIETSIGTTSNKGFTKVVTTPHETICDYKRYCRDICFSILDNNSNSQIQGQWLHAEIYESKFGKTQYNRGRVETGQWLFGGICHETREFFVITVPKCDFQ